MLRALEADLRGGGRDGIELLVRDASAPGLPGSSYDVVTASLVLFFLPDPVAALTAWRELLRPDGRLGFTTFGTRDDVWSRIDEVVEAYLPPAVLDARTCGQTGPFASTESTAALATTAGFADASTVESGVEVRYDSLEAWNDRSWTVGLRAFWLAVPEDERPVVKEGVFEILGAAAGCRRQPRRRPDRPGDHRPLSGGCGARCPDVRYDPVSSTTVSGPAGGCRPRRACDLACANAASRSPVT